MHPTVRPDDLYHREVFAGITLTYLISSVILLALAGLATWIGGDWVGVPLGFWQVWGFPLDIAGGLSHVALLFAWGFALTLILGGLSILWRVPREARPSTIFIRGTWLSLNAGFFEEVVFRWLLLLVAPLVLKVLNFITFGLIRWIYVEGLIPLADWATLGLLNPQLTAGNWLLGAAIITVNGRFRQGHVHKGWLAAVNAWFIGMVMFYLLFNYGMWTAIIAHALYDICVFWTAAFLTNFQPRQPRYFF